MSKRSRSEAFATAPDGTRIRYVTWANPNATRRVVLIHALANVAEFWSATVDALGPEWEALAVDCRGHGASGKPAGPYSVELMADDIAAVMDHAGWDSAVVAGASMGGCIAMAVAARHPARVAGLGLIDTTAWYGENAVTAWEERGQKAVDGGMAALIGFQKTRWFSDAFRESQPEILQDAIDTFTANDVSAYLETCRMLGRADMRAALGSFQCPVAVMVGEEDYATPIAMAEALVAAVPDASLTIVPGARHLTPLEVPDTVAEIIMSV
ncbi:alpha/beta fold hydrolase [Cognatishimia sp. F0-27]|uniref:alpha/beta fold hydrolase n=1 Tax=Cognatishimia sp. F0-27 TaxID=2816855 RepID=UPI001D0BFAD0|nr:alpha/beta hydrolase [Cognatishimia sp. F0-27]MCC1494556.1 alpha/beta fold hydrolase [Cognatishimia sp. F0-27]